MELSHGQAVIRLDQIREEVERLSAKDDLTPDDENTFATLSEEYREVDRHRRSLERQAQLEAIRSAARGCPVEGKLAHPAKVERGTGPVNPVDSYDADPVLNPDSVQEGRFRNPWDLSEVRTFGRDRSELASEYRARALSAIEKMPGANDPVRQAATEIIEQFDDGKATLARQALVTSSPAYMRAWVKTARGHQHLLTQDEQRAMSLTDNAGGYLTPFQLDPTVIITANGSRNQIRQVARQVVAVSDVWNGVSSGAVSWSWDAEASQVSDDTTTFAQPTISIFKAAGFIPISIEALEDEQNVTAEVARLLAFGRDVLEAAAFATGSGSQPQGIVTALVAASPSVTVNSTTTDTFAAADVYKVDGALPARYRANASWLANRGWYNLVRQFDTGGGAQLWERIGSDVPPQLLGRPALESEDMDGVINTTQENYMAVYGDFSNYVIADRVGMRVEFINHLFQQTTAGSGFGRPTGQRGWYAYYRVGADSVNDGGFRLLDVT
jgi:HK97 family phage major capsid protein